MMIRLSDEAQIIARRRERHWTMLCCSIAIVILALALRVRDDQRVELRVFPGYPLPESCMMRICFNRACPGCGLTRSFVYLANGDWYQSLAMNRVGWLFALAVLAQFPYRLVLLRQPIQTASQLWARWFGGILVAALVGNWLYNVTNEYRR